MNTEGEKMKKIYTICLLVRPGEVLLGLKKRGFLVGKLNGSGGKLQGDETLEDCGKRETWEEFGVQINTMKKFGEVFFYDPDLTHECHVFVVTSWEGEPCETEEMKPSWYRVEDVPYQMMGQADKFWLPSILEGKKICASFYYEDSDDLEKLTRKVMRFVDSF
ncbi:8-oxo-dGTP diphosphatase [Candidatus Parcubacteria bacterium]|nr:8-oxo-dGTP diphosphatase [Patescibacteria group bacterium]MBU4380862.1 8-oxo-dGTP diphosphatase [Patescibacteria group bacterium]MCG2688913.1 8-oxo-dGTP diphosphatase [Candidatus Parcubacteria bacterium]